MAKGPEAEADSSAMGEPDIGARVASLEAQIGALQAEMSALRTAAQARPWPVVPVGVQEPPVPAAFVPIAAPAAAAPPLPSRSVVSAEPDVPRQSFENQFGANVLSKVAIVFLLLGVAWFLKWAFDNSWIGPSGRILAGLIASIGIVLWSEHFRRKQLAAFSYALKAVGSGTLYLCLWASFQIYHLVPASVAFSAMVGVTVWNAVMAWSQDSQLLAAYALLGAYLTPLLLSTGGNHEVFLFSYLGVIATGVVALLRSKPWNALLLGALPVTAAFYAAWYSAFFSSAGDEIAPTLVFSLMLWAIFAAAPLIAKKSDDVIAGVLVPLGAGAFGALTLYAVLADSSNQRWEPWCAVGFAAVYLLLARVGRKGVVSAMHLTLGIVFLIVTVPLKATGRGITLGWLVEAVALLWVSTLELDGRTRKVLRWLGCASLLLGAGGALVEPYLLDRPTHAFANREFATSLAAVVALACVAWLESRATGEKEREPMEGVIAAASMVLLNVVLLFAMHREIQNIVEVSMGGRWGDVFSHADFYFTAWMMAQGAAMLALGFWRRLSLARWIGLVLLALTIVWLFVDLQHLSSGYRVIGYLGLGALLMAVSYAYQKDLLGLRKIAIAAPQDPRSADDSEASA